MDDQVEGNAVRFHLILESTQARRLSFPLENFCAQSCRIQMEAQSPASKETLNMENFSKQTV